MTPDQYIEWEYETVTTIIAFRDVKRNLILMGSQGWRLAFVHKYLFIFADYIFERQKTTNP